MGAPLFEKVRSVDFVSAVRAWPTARERYLERGFLLSDQPINLATKSKISVRDTSERLKASETLEKFRSALIREEIDAAYHGLEEFTPELKAYNAASRTANKLTNEALNAIQGGDDDAAVPLLDSAWAACDGDTLLAVLADVASRKLVVRRLEQALPSIMGDAVRLKRYLQWLDAAPSLDFARGLRGEAARSTAPVGGWPFFAKAAQSRAMEAWVRLYDETEGFNSPPLLVASHLEAIARQPGYSRIILSFVLPSLAQVVGSISRLDDRRLALRELLAAMIVHAETGARPDGV